ncbi:hypothetical protein RFI_23307 [Reticulomyxa filosa]|uniref:Uncharacterized protein n=1 Tax=Reticulomyxa filosa TaxID=46433 RepID=X6MLU9_RETFI|nr:hypothetical protein RFI_23307 [Reticulomyxa filosa]|eukprot:ETO14060.1 hypothetical protein RFI_23307 [Reticulomyxa filosa]
MIPFDIIFSFKGKLCHFPKKKLINIADKEMSIISAKPTEQVSWWDFLWGPNRKKHLKILITQKLNMFLINVSVHYYCYRMDSVPINQTDLDSFHSGMGGKTIAPIESYVYHSDCMLFDEEEMRCESKDSRYGVCMLYWWHSSSIDWKYRIKFEIANRGAETVIGVCSNIHEYITEGKCSSGVWNPEVHKGYYLYFNEGRSEFTVLTNGIENILRIHYQAPQAGDKIVMTVDSTNITMQFEFKSQPEKLDLQEFSFKTESNIPLFPIICFRRSDHDNNSSVITISQIEPL